MQLYIEKLKLKEPPQCEFDDCFEDAEWFVEGEFYCDYHMRDFAEYASVDYDVPARAERRTR